MIPTVILALLMLAFCLIWWTPKSCRYLADILTRRARAYEAAGKAYKQAWHEGEQLNLIGMTSTAAVFDQEALGRYLGRMED